MTTEQLRRVHGARPFTPFAVFLADGRTIPVRHPKNLSFQGGGRVIHVHHDADGPEIIDLLLVTSLKPTPKRGPESN